MIDVPVTMHSASSFENIMRELGAFHEVLTRNGDCGGGGDGSSRHSSLGTRTAHGTAVAVANAGRGAVDDAALSSDQLPGWQRANQSDDIFVASALRTLPSKRTEAQVATLMRWMRTVSPFFDSFSEVRDVLKRVCRAIAEGGVCTGWRVAGEWVVRCSYRPPV